MKPPNLFSLGVQNEHLVQPQTPEIWETQLQRTFYLWCGAFIPQKMLGKFLRGKLVRIHLSKLKKTAMKSRESVAMMLPIEKKTIPVNQINTNTKTEPKSVVITEPEVIAEPEAIEITEPVTISEPEPVDTAESEVKAESEAVEVDEPETIALPESVEIDKLEVITEPETVEIDEPDLIAEPEPVEIDDPQTVALFQSVEIAEPEVITETEPIEIDESETASPTASESLTVTEIPEASKRFQPLHLITCPINTQELERLTANPVFSSISASAAARLLLMEQYLPGGREQLCEPIGVIANQFDAEFLHPQITTLRLLEMLAVHWGGLFGADWILNGTVPAGAAFGQYNPGVVNLHQLWVLHLFRCNGFVFPEPGRLIYLSRKSELFAEDERFKRLSSTLCGRLLLIRTAAGITLAEQRNVLETECRAICRAKENDFHLLHLALKNYADRAGVYWLKTGKGMPGAFFLTAIQQGADWLSNAEIQLHRELLCYPELPETAAPEIRLAAERYCTGCGAPLYGAAQKKYCTSVCQQRSKRLLKKQPQTEKPGHEQHDRAKTTSGSYASDKERSPDFIQLIAELLKNGDTKHTVLIQLETMLRKNGQHELADMLSDEKLRKTILQGLHDRFKD